MFYNEKQTEEQSEFRKEFYSNKTKKLLYITLGILIFDFITYFISPFDFGIFFEATTFIFVLITIHFLNKGFYSKVKTNIIIAMIPIGWLIIYDLIDLFSHIGDIISELSYFYNNADFLYYTYNFNFFDISLILILLFLFASYKTLTTSQNPNKYENMTEWFYDQK